MAKCDEELNEEKVKRDIINSKRAVFMTPDSFLEHYSLLPQIDYLIIDEAHSMTEIQTLVALSINPKIVIMLGDIL
jgi:superfamily I DNA and/or RNA helicase